MTETFLTHNEQGTLEIATAFAQTLKPGMIVALSGELGAGKTVFARGIARALGVHDKITSPTFTLINEYRGDIMIYHMDFYRLNSIGEILDIGVEDYFFGDGVCLVEWPENMSSRFPEDAVRVTIRYGSDNNRDIIIERRTAP